ncbi:MAG TPA: nucleoside hydrolase, partial [Bryobacteraceae bacterium]|nr:nucleoside hydrolase [Bryobacteraceae bacterium]
MLVLLMLTRALLMPVLAFALAAAPPVPIIFDTDIGNDIDDALALAMIHALESRGECRLLGITLTNPAANAGPYTSLVNRFYGRPAIPIGVSRAVSMEGAYHNYLDAPLNGAPQDLRASNEKFEEAVPLLRRLLAQSTEKVVLIQVGFSENLAALLDTKGDSISPLDGPALIRDKVSLLSIMAGDFAT